MKEAVIDTGTTFQILFPFMELPVGTFIPKNMSNKFYVELKAQIDLGLIEVRQPTPITVVPNTITRLQALVTLSNMGLLDSVQNIVNTSSDEILKLAFANAQEFKRTSPMLLSLAATLGLSDTDLDTLFINASKIEV